MKKLITLLSILPVLALAQSTQPQYVRPAKGANIALFTNYTLDVATPAPPNSPVFDMTAFNAVQVRVEAKNAATGADIGFSQCTRLPGILTGGSLTKDGAFSTEFFDQNGQFSNYPTTNISVTYTVNRVSPYVKFTTFNYANMLPNAPAGTLCSFTASMTPLPFQTGYAVVEPRLTGREADVVAVNNVGGSTVYRYSPPGVTAIGNRIPYVRVQNVGTVPLVCLLNDPSNPGALSTSHYSFALAAGTADNDGTGGVMELKNLSSFSGIVSCLAIGAPGRAAVFSYFELSP